jgi:TPR repeat protein
VKIKTNITNFNPRLGIKLLNGDGVIKDTTRAIEWLKKSTNIGYKHAPEYLAHIYYTGRCRKRLYHS